MGISEKNLERSLYKDLEKSLHDNSKEAQEAREAYLEENIKLTLGWIRGRLKPGEEAAILEVVYRQDPEMYGPTSTRPDPEPEAHDPHFLIGNYLVLLGKDGITRKVKADKGGDFKEFRKAKPLPIEEYLKSHLNDFTCDAETPEQLGKGILSYKNSGTPNVVIINYWDPEDTK